MIIFIITIDTLTQGVVSACSENPLKDELNYYFDNSDSAIQNIIVNVAKVIYTENTKAISDIKKAMKKHSKKELL